jgi:hypothetical protein
MIFNKEDTRIEDACKELDIPLDFMTGLESDMESEIDLGELYKIKKTYLKKQYRKFALASHPDKNEGISPESFQKVKDAYDLLTKELDGERRELEELDLSESDLSDPDLTTFSIIPPYLSKIITGITQSSFFEENSEMIETILDKVFIICEKQMIKWLENIELHKYKIAYKVLKKFRYLFRLSDEFYLLLEELDKKRMNMTININVQNTKSILEQTVQNIETLHILLEPTIEDVLEDMIYSLWKDGKQYLIPLWHHELVYDHFGNDLFIQIEPFVLPESLWIDCENHVHRSMEFSLVELFELSQQEKELEIRFGKKKVYLLPSELTLNPKQTYTWKREGIAKIQEERVYDSSERGDLILEVVIRL